MSGIETTPDGVKLTVRLTPRGGRDAIDGTQALSDGRTVIKARVRAVPEDGAANAALIALIADAAGVPKRDAEVCAGHTSRIKTIIVRGDSAALHSRLTAALERKTA